MPRFPNDMDAARALHKKQRAQREKKLAEFKARRERITAEMEALATELRKRNNLPDDAPVTMIMCERAGGK